jgi:phosphonate transport system permease protein
MPMLELLHFFAQFFPPDLSWHYVRALAGPVGESIGMAAAAMTLAFAVSFPLGLWIGLRLPGFRILVVLLTALRSIPDLTLAILCVIGFGIGAGAGTLALGIYYAAAVSKMLGDLFVTAPRRPIEALAATGASRLQIAFYGLLPLTRSDLLSYGSYEFESAIRASVVIGAVGGGGLGSELIGSLAALDYHRVTTQILVLVLLVAVFDKLTVWLRRYPGMIWALLPPGLACVVFFASQMTFKLSNLRALRMMFPPRLNMAEVHGLPVLVIETILMALAGTAIAVLIAIPLSAASCRNLAPAWLAIPTRRLLETLRAIPELVWGLLLVAYAGVGPIAGALALALHSAGCLGKLFAECLENVPVAPVAAVTATGAGPGAVFAYATAPLAFGPAAAHALFRLDWNLRMATVVGLIGAGGIGQALYNAQQLFFYRTMMAYLLITWLLVMGFDALNAWIRRSYGLQRGAAA